MSTLLFTLTAANLGIYFVFASLFTIFQSMYPAAAAAMLIGPAAVALGAFAARKKEGLQYVFAVLPFLSLLLAKSLEQGFLLLPAAIYPAGLILAGRFTVSYWAYRNHFLVSSIVLFLPMAVVQVGETRISTVLFGVIALVLGAFTLRQLQFGQLTGAKQKSFALLGYCAIPAGAALAALLVFRAKEIGKGAAEYVFYPIGYAMERTAAFFDSLIADVPDTLPEKDESSTILSSMEEIQGAPGAFSEAEAPNATIGMIIRYVLILSIAAIVIWIIVALIRRLAESKTDETLSDRTILETTADEASVRAGADPQRMFSNRRKIRRIYERYLKLLSRRHFIRKPQDSSEDILEKTREISAQAPAQALRELYILARYHPDAVITDAQVKEGRRLLNQLRQEQKTDN